MKVIRKICISSDGSLYFDKALLTPNSSTFSFCALEDEKNFFLNKKNKIRKLNFKSSLKYKKKYFN